MKKQHTISRRAAVKSSIFGLLAASIPSVGFAKEIIMLQDDLVVSEKLFHRYPSIDDALVQEVVGASHSNLDKIKTIVGKRPEMARATWDWAYGDWETALGAASHVGRRDIAAFLMQHGARPNIFTYAMLGNFKAVRAMIEATPGVQSIKGPHGISLLSHAKAGLRAETLSELERNDSRQLIDYLESLGNADKNPVDLEMTDELKANYLGDYMYGQGPADGFSVKLNMRNSLTLGRLGDFGGALYQKALNTFTYNNMESVEVTFLVNNEQVLSLTVKEPDLELTAKKLIG